MVDAPLGPIRRVEKRVGNKTIEYWLDEIGNEYVSLDHIGLCAVARALEL